ncbi:MAG: hypothetical protein DWI26_03400 [Planctomycetota bacterium]|nr:MAG: hypothetical protein DWI26_03400 [Planctomycetota bacterium]
MEFVVVVHAPRGDHRGEQRAQRTSHSDLQVEAGHRFGRGTQSVDQSMACKSDASQCRNAESDQAVPREPQFQDDGAQSE